MSDIIGITMGDPAGVGPEISVKALAEMTPEDRARTLIYGNLATLEAARAAVGVDLDLTDRVVNIGYDGAPCPGASCRRSRATPPSALSSARCATRRPVGSAASSPRPSTKRP